MARRSTATDNEIRELRKGASERLAEHCGWALDGCNASRHLCALALDKIDAATGGEPHEESH